VIKRLTFVRRATDVATEEFGSSWRDARLKNLDALPSALRPVRLVQLVVRPSGATPTWDGVEISWHSVEESATDSTQWAKVGELDESIDGSALTVTVAERTVSGEHWLADRWCQGGSLGVVLVGFIEAAEGLTRLAFRDYWWDQHRPLANSLVPDDVAPVAYVHDYLLDERASDDHVAWAGIGEMYERSLGTARRRGEWFESEAARPLIPDEERFMVRSTRQVLVTDGEVLYHRPVN